MAGYKTKPVFVTAYHAGFEKPPAWLTENGRKLSTFVCPACANQHGRIGYALHTIDLGGERYDDVFDGDYVVKNPDGTFAIYKAEAFEEAYEPWDATWMDPLPDVLASAGLCLEHWHEMAPHRPEYELLKRLIQKQNEQMQNEPLSFEALIQAGKEGTPVWNKLFGVCFIYSANPTTGELVCITSEGFQHGFYGRTNFYACEYKEAPALGQEGT